MNATKLPTMPKRLAGETCLHCKCTGHPIEWCPDVLAALVPGYGLVQKEEGESLSDFAQRRAKKAIDTMRSSRYIQDDRTITRQVESRPVVSAQTLQLSE